MAKYRRRVLVYVTLIVLIGGFLAFSCVGTWKQIAQNKKSKEELTIKYNNLLKSEETLEGQVVKLQDPEYVLKYAREKYYFSKPGEIIINISYNKNNKDNEDK